MIKEELEREAEVLLDELDDWGIGNDWSIAEAYRNGYIAGVEAHSVQWHDLRKDPNDLPESDRENMYYVVDKDGRYALAWYYCGIWSDMGVIENVVAWYELPEFEELKKGDK